MQCLLSQCILLATLSKGGERIWSSSFGVYSVQTVQHMVLLIEYRDDVVTYRLKDYRGFLLLKCTICFLL